MTLNERISLPIWRRIILYLISFILFCVQIFVIFVALNYGINQSFYGPRWVYPVTIAIGFIFVLYIIHKPMNTAYKLTWSILILAFPVVFTIIYILNSTSRRLSKRSKREINQLTKSIKLNDDINQLELFDPKAAALVRTIQSSTFAPVDYNVETTFFDNGASKFEDMFSKMKQAKKFIFIEFFIIGKGYLLNDLYEILKQKGSEGVQIKILYDDIGSARVLSRGIIKKIAQIPNCKIANYEPLGLNIKFVVNNRDHRKIVVIDGEVAYCGGDNLSDEYANKKIRFGYWRDNCMKYEGRTVRTFSFLFAQMWYTSTKDEIDLSSLWSNDYIGTNTNYVCAFGDGPLFDGTPAYDLFLSLFTVAEKEILISTPYFIIDDIMIDLLALKIKQGIKVKLLMPKIPDKKSAFYMGRSNYRKILLAGGEIYEFTPGFNHAKNIIIDGKYAFIGTVNMDYRSMYLHYECGALLINDNSILEMRKDYLKAIEKSENITYEKWRKRPWYQKFAAFILNIFAPMF